MFKHGRPLDQPRVNILEACPVINLDELLDRRIPVGGKARRAIAAQHEHIVERLAKISKVALAAHFPREPPVGTKRKPDRARGAMLGQHPVQRRVREGRIEGFAEFQLGGIHQTRVEPVRARGGDHAQAVVDPDDLGPALLDLERQAAVAAADIEDMLARLRIEQVERRFAERGHEPADARIIARVPLAGRNRLVIGMVEDQSVLIHSRYASSAISASSSL